MDFSSRNVKILASVVVSTAMIGVAVLLSNPTTQKASALSTDELLRAYVEQDTDADGLPDWQEKIYETDPTNPESVQAGMTDAEAVQQGLVSPAFLSEAPAPDPVGDDDFSIGASTPGSITDRFSLELFQTLMAAGGSLTPERQEVFLQEFIARYSKEAAAGFSSTFDRSQVRLSNDAVAAYATKVEGVLVANQPPVGAENPAALAEALLVNGDTGAKGKLESLAASYERRAAVLATIAAPREFTAAHVDIVRAYETLGKATRAVAAYEADPISALGATGVYIPTAELLMDAFGVIAQELLDAGVERSIIVELAHQSGRL